MPHSTRFLTAAFLAAAGSSSASGQDSADGKAISMTLKAPRAERTLKKLP